MKHNHSTIPIIFLLGMVLVFSVLLNLIYVLEDPVDLLAKLNNKAFCKTDKTGGTHCYAVTPLDLAPTEGQQEMEK